MNYVEFRLKYQKQFSTHANIQKSPKYVLSRTKSVTRRNELCSNRLMQFFGSTDKLRKRVYIYLARYCADGHGPSWLASGSRFRLYGKQQKIKKKKTINK